MTKEGLFPKRTIEITIDQSEFTNYVGQAFDYKFTGKSVFELPEFSWKEDFVLGLIVGSSGSGKTQILKHYFGYEEREITWRRNKCIGDDLASSASCTVEMAVEKLNAVGIGSIPTMCKPYHVLSVGEKGRADIARQLKSGAIIDEFTSTVNRETAKSLSASISKYIREKGLHNIVIASCHRDIIPWLEPDVFFDCDLGSVKMIDQVFRKRVAKIELY